MRALVARCGASSFTRFLVSGGVNTAVTYALYFALLPFVSYRVSYTVAYSAGIAIAYLFNRHLVFFSHRGMLSVVLLPLVYLAQYLISLAVLWLWIDKAGLSASTGPLVVIALTVPVTYLLSRKIFSVRGSSIAGNPESMRLRDDIRRVRLYYKSLPLFFSALELPLRALVLPFMHVTARFRSKSGVDLDVPPRAWDQLPNLCRLAQIGACCRFEADCKRIELDGYTFFSPLKAKVEGDFLREIFREDVYRMKNRMLRGKVAVDVGAFFGDSSIPMAKMGATVYAFEPSVARGELLRRNLAANNVGDLVHFFNAGLSTRARRENAGSEELNFVDGVPFVIANVPREVDLLKMDCEGCEYPLFEDARFLEYLAPAEIVMEYHQGEKRLVEILKDCAYTVEIVPCGDKVGYIYAKRVAA